MKKIIIYESVLILLVCPVMHSQLKEIKSQAMARVDKPDTKDDFQLVVRYSLSDLPKDAIVTDASLIIDQNFESEGGVETPRGLVNNTQEPILFSIYGFSGGSAPQTDKWTDVDKNKSAFLSSNFLSPKSVLKAERKEGRRSTTAIEFTVSNLVRTLLKQQIGTVVFVIAKKGKKLKATDLDCDISKLSGRLVVGYVLEPQSPPWLNNSN